MKDIENREDIQNLVDSFYEDVLKDDLIGHFFTEVVAVNWERHLPVMYDFWESVILSAGAYSGNPIIKHIDLHLKFSLKPKHFDRWLSLWANTVNRLFEGPMAESAVSKAKQLAQLIQLKIDAVAK